MSGFDPGEGWRMEQFPDEVPTGVVAFREDDGSWSYWVREVPLPPLPIEPYTVIRVEWKDGQPAKEYALIGGRWGVMRPDEVAEQMAGFAVLAEPRAVTAKAVLDRVHDMTNSITTHLAISAIGRDFGVTE